MNGNEEKRLLRKQVRSLFPGQEQRDSESLSLCNHLHRIIISQNTGTIGAYMASSREADLNPLLERLWRMGRNTCVPRCLPDGGMEFRRIKGFSDLEKGNFSLSEPAKSCPIVPPEDIGLILVPLEAVDREGHRLGKGGGYYDRYLSMTGALRIGVALSHQLVDSVPAEEHDMVLDACVLPSEFLVFNSERIRPQT